jgi:hypothetical protein
VENGNGGRYSILDPERNLTPTLMIRRFALAVWSWLGLRPLGLRIALRSCTGRASPLWLALRARGSGFALAARALHSRLALCVRG